MHHYIKTALVIASLAIIGSILFEFDLRATGGCFIFLSLACFMFAPLISEGFQK